MSTSTAITHDPAIDSDHHGPMVVLAGGVFLAATILMVFISFYNRYLARTFLHFDHILLVLGVVSSQYKSDKDLQKKKN
jgi:hypothetical protein